MLTRAELEAICTELAADLPGGRVQRIAATADFEWTFEFYGQFAPVPGETTVHKKRWLVLCVHPRLGRIHLAGGWPGAEPRQDHFLALLRAHLDRAKLTGVSLAKADRIVEFQFEQTNNPQSAIRNPHFLKLIVELTGGSANVFLLDADNRVLGWGRPGHDPRNLRRGEHYFAPPGSTTPVPATASTSRFEGKSGVDLHDTVAMTYADAQAETEAAAIRRRIERALRKEREFVVKKVADIENALAEKGGYLDDRRRGELLKAYAPQIPDGAKTVTLTDYDDEGKKVEVLIPVDPRLSAIENAQAYFDRYHKSLTASQKLGIEINVLRALDAELKAIEREYAGLEDDGLDDFVARDDVKHLLERYASGRHKAVSPDDDTTELSSALKAVPANMRPRKFTSVDGWDIYAGKGAEGNDYLTTKMAHGNDWFFHIAGAPGSHIILRGRGEETPPMETLLDCAQLALHFSKQKDASRGSVTYAQKKHVKKPTGAKPGLVIVNKGKSLTVRADEARLKRLMGK